MALIICTECGKKISSFATTCPNCGYPQNSLIKQRTTNPITLVEDFDIGDKITDWKISTKFEGIYHQAGHFATNIPNGKVSVSLHYEGIRISRGNDSYDIHKSQIINIDRSPSERIITTNKSIISRAIIMGIFCAVIGYYITHIWCGITVDSRVMNNDNDLVSSILSTISIVKLGNIIDTIAFIVSIMIGSTGAIIGGMLGLCQQEELINTQYVTINFWHKDCDTPQSILIECNEKEQISTFIDRQERFHNTSPNKKE